MKSKKYREERNETMTELFDRAILEMNLKLNLEENDSDDDEKYDIIVINPPSDVIMLETKFMINPDGKKREFICRRCSEHFILCDYYEGKVIDCPYCDHHRTYITPKALHHHGMRVEHITSDKYDFSKVESLDSAAEVEIRCLTCKRSFLQCPDIILRGIGCMRCYEKSRKFSRYGLSKGEFKIMVFLEALKLGYVTQKTFPDLFDKILLRFDFFIPSFNLLIEFDEKLHYEDIFGDSFEYMRIHDSMKDYYVARSGLGTNLLPLSLIRITFNQLDKIGTILNEGLHGRKIIYTSKLTRFNSEILENYNLFESVHYPTKDYGTQYIYSNYVRQNIKEIKIK
ncbi:MAG: hypothetical protein A2X09_14230 [Bacteroidetes bacterium GWF2_43_11]|nr:MAG: hypothetical protein A2X09_14230 [Bacteroidetes bacterium GWF2_43_11]